MGVGVIMGSSNGYARAATSAPLHHSLSGHEEEAYHEDDQEYPAGPAAPFPLPGAPGGPAFMGIGFMASRGTRLNWGTPRG